MIQITDISRRGGGCGCGGGACGCGAGAGHTARHDEILESLGWLQPGAELVMTADCDPVDLLARVGERFGDDVSWEYDAQDPGDYRVRFLREA